MRYNVRQKNSNFFVVPKAWQSHPRRPPQTNDNMTVLDYSSGTKKEMGLATANVVNIGDKTSMEITLNPGFNWVESVSPLLPGCPKSCPANHFGFLKSGCMKVHYDDGTTATVNAGESYLIPPGHLPEVVGDVPWYVPKTASRNNVMLCALTRRYFSYVVGVLFLAPQLRSLTRPRPRTPPQRDGRVLPVHRRRHGFHEEVSDVGEARLVHKGSFVIASCRSPALGRTSIFEGLVFS